VPPRPRRSCWGSAAAGLVLLIGGGILVRALLGKNPLTRLALSGQTVGAPVTSADGRAFRYHLASTAKNWYFRKPELASKDNALADIWLIQPQEDAHVLVIAERYPGGPERRPRPLRAGRHRQRAQARRHVHPRGGRSPSRTARAFARLVHTKARMKGIDLEFYYGLYAREPEIYQVVASTHSSRFGAMEPQLLEWVSSLETRP
jgi:hypothetical protein